MSDLYPAQWIFNLMRINNATLFSLKALTLTHHVFNPTSINLKAYRVLKSADIMNPGSTNLGAKQFETVMVLLGFKGSLESRTQDLLNLE